MTQRIAPPTERIAFLERQLAEYIAVHKVLVAAGLVSEEKIRQAFELVDHLRLADPTDGSRA